MCREPTLDLADLRARATLRFYAADLSVPEVFALVHDEPPGTRIVAAKAFVTVRWSDYGAARVRDELLLADRSIADEGDEDRGDDEPSFVLLTLSGSFRSLSALARRIEADGRDLEFEVRP